MGGLLQPHLQAGGEGADLGSRPSQFPEEPPPTFPTLPSPNVTLNPLKVIGTVNPLPGYRIFKRELQEEENAWPKWLKCGGRAFWH